MIEAVAKGVWLGFCIAAPVGPIGTLVLKQSIRWGHRAGLASGLGAALADLTFGLLATAGVRLATGYTRPLALFGGGFLLWLAWKSWQETPVENISVAEQETYLRNVATTFVLTLSNPITILSFAALITSAGITSPIQFVTGIFLGSMAWWVILSTAAEWFATFIALRPVLLNRLAAATLAVFGLWVIFQKVLR